MEDRPAKKLANPAPNAMIIVRKIDGSSEESGGLGGIDDDFEDFDDCEFDRDGVFLSCVDDGIEVAAPGLSLNPSESLMDVGVNL